MHSETCWNSDCGAYKHCYVGLLSKALCLALLCVTCSWISSSPDIIPSHTPAAIWGVFRSSDSSTNTIKSHSLHVSVSQGICRNKQKIRLQVSFSFYIKVRLKYPCMERLEGIWSVSAVSQLFLWAGAGDRDNCSSMLSVCSSHSQRLSLSRLRLNE